jgi:MFS superfamily sulfate permease-like transporter
MFSNALIGFFAALGFGAWVYSKMQRQTGGNTQSALVVAGGAALLGFLFVITLLSFFPE